MIRDVTIYGITSHQARGGSFVDMYRMPPLDSFFPIGGGEALMVERETVQRLQLKVHTIHRIGRGDEYIAIEPELERILVLPFKARLAEAERKAEQQAREAAGLRQRIAAFNALPWYRRVWAAIRRTA
jgi:hypothetical protein